jgi:hypothetical protein
MGGMNRRVVLLSVLNALVAVALAVLITVLVTRGDAPTVPAPEGRAARLKGELMDREELIPFDGQLGGTMDFYEPGGEVSWRVLEARLE